MVPLEAFYAEYEPGDMLSIVHACVQILPVLLFVGIVAIIAVSRQISVASTALGMVVTNVICKVLKKLIQQPRPERSPRSGFGMPSEHAAFVSFFACTMIFILLRMKVKPSLLKPSLTMAFAGMPVLVGWSRVQYRAHTVEQVAVGAVIGVCMGLAWLQLEKRIDMRRWQRRLDDVLSFSFKRD